MLEQFIFSSINYIISKFSLKKRVMINNTLNIAIKYRGFNRANEHWINSLTYIYIYVILLNYVFNFY